MLAILRPSRLDRVSWEMQPAGQASGEMAGAGVVGYMSRKGRARRNCGRPGKNAKARIKTAMKVKYLDCVISIMLSCGGIVEGV